MYSRLKADIRPPRYTILTIHRVCLFSQPHLCLRSLRRPPGRSTRSGGLHLRYRCRLRSQYTSSVLRGHLEGMGGMNQSPVDSGSRCRTTATRTTRKMQEHDRTEHSQCCVCRFVRERLWIDVSQSTMRLKNRLGSRTYKISLWTENS